MTICLMMMMTRSMRLHQTRCERNLLKGLNSTRHAVFLSALCASIHHYLAPLARSPSSFDLALSSTARILQIRPRRHESRHHLRRLLAFFRSINQARNTACYYYYCCCCCYCCCCYCCCCLRAGMLLLAGDPSPSLQGNQSICSFAQSTQTDSNKSFST